MIDFYMLMSWSFGGRSLERKDLEDKCIKDNWFFSDK